jgi:DNA-binding response OmpR family regulator
MKPILLVEDDDNDVLFLQHSFAKIAPSIALHRVADGREAIDYLAGTGSFADREKHPIPCAVLLDLNLPHKTGFDVLKWIRAQAIFAGMVVIILTASRAEADIAQAYSLHVNSYIVKPSKPNELCEFAILFRDYWLRWNQTPQTLPGCQ